MVDQIENRVLVSTIMPSPGGVNTMTTFVVNALRSWGLEPVIAHYQPYSVSPRLSVPSFKLPFGRIGQLVSSAYDGCESHAIGAWLPELEFTHYLPSQHWQRLMMGCDAFISVSGNVLAATPFARSGRPYVAWVATDWQGDRRDRIKGFPMARKFLDTCVNAPVLRRFERRLLRGGTTLALSGYTRRKLQTIAGEASVHTVLPMPVDIAGFSPAPAARVPLRLGFSGRFDDPRKNLPLFLQSMALLRKRGHNVTAVLIGGVVTDGLQASVQALGLSGQVQFVGHVPPEKLAQWLQTLDVFVLPSHQEGLCIAALEAMACGVPVVSTQCGGPEEFVIAGQTGILVEPDPAQMATAIEAIITQPDLRQKLSNGARRMVEDRYTARVAKATLREAMQKTFPHLQLRPEGHLS